jgi:hypothetical protein
MQIGKLWTAGVAIVFCVLLAACYNDDGPSTSGDSSTPSTNNLAPSTLANRSFTLQYSAGPLAGNLETLQISADSLTFVRTPEPGFGTQSTGNFLTPVLSQGGNIWTAGLNTTITNGITATNTLSETLTLTFTAAQTGTFTVVAPGGGSSSGVFNLTAIAAARPLITREWAALDLGHLSPHSSLAHSRSGHLTGAANKLLLKITSGIQRELQLVSFKQTT